MHARIDLNCLFMFTTHNEYIMIFRMYITSFLPVFGFHASDPPDLGINVRTLNALSGLGGELVDSAACMEE